MLNRIFAAPISHFRCWIFHGSVYWLSKVILLAAREEEVKNSRRPWYYNYFTLILKVAFLPLPSVAMAVIFIVFPLAVFLVLTTPLALTVAYFMLEDVHCNFLFAFFVAVTSAFNFRLFPALTVFAPVIFTFFTIPFMEVTFQDAETFILSFDAVIVTFFPPVFFFTVTTPFALTVATFVLLDFQINCFVILSGNPISALKFTFLPAAICFGLPVALKGFIAGAFVVLPDGFVVLLDGFWVP